MAGVSLLKNGETYCRSRLDLIDPNPCIELAMPVLGAGVLATSNFLNDDFFECIPVVYFQH